MNSEPVFYYRFYDALYSDDEADLTTGNRRSHVSLYAYPVIRETPQSVVLNVHGQEKRVMRGALRSYAHPTIKDALRSFRKRKWFEIGHTEFRLERARSSYEQAKELEADAQKIPEVHYVSPQTFVHSRLKKS